MNTISRKTFLRNSGFGLGLLWASEILNFENSLFGSRAAAQGQSIARWARPLFRNITEFSSTALQVISGQIPSELEGTLYRNGPGRLERDGVRVPHWFDGDGAVLAVTLQGGNASAQYKYVQTKAMIEEEKAGKFLYPGLGYLPEGPFWKRSALNMKNPANTAILALPDKILALWEGGRPYALNPQTLETLGEEDLGFLGSRDPFCAHPKRDPLTGGYYAFGTAYGATNHLVVYELSDMGTLRRKASVNIPHASVIHDFVLCDEYLIFVVPPVVTEILPALVGSKSVEECMKWQPERGTTYIVVNKETLTTVCTLTGDPLFMWHFAPSRVNARGQIELHFVAYKSFENNLKWLSEVTSGQITTMGTLSYLTRVVLDLGQKKIVSTEQLSNCVCEFPTSDPRQTSNQNRYVFTATFGQQDITPQDGANGISRIDLQTGADETVKYDDLATSEALYVPRPGKPNEGYLMSMVNSTSNLESFLSIYNAERLQEGPCCQLKMPCLIPPTFHGAWQPR